MATEYKTKIARATSEILKVIEPNGLRDNLREGLKDTPDRVARAYEYIYGGYDIDVADLITVFKDDHCDEMVVLKDIEFYSMCEHHMLPFYGKAHIAYIPNGKVIGVSKLARILDVYARRLQIQERLGKQVVDALMHYLDPLGAACYIEAQHLCMKMRGVEKQSSKMVTSSLDGVFKTKPETRAEFLSAIGI